MAIPARLFFTCSYLFALFVYQTNLLYNKSSIYMLRINNYDQAIKKGKKEQYGLHPSFSAKFSNYLYKKAKTYFQESYIRHVTLCVLNFSNFHIKEAVKILEDNFVNKQKEIQELCNLFGIV